MDSQTSKIDRGGASALPLPMTSESQKIASTASAEVFAVLATTNTRGLVDGNI